MRSAVSRLIECCAATGLDLDMPTRRLMLNTLDDNLKHPTGDIQAVRIRMSGPLCRPKAQSASPACPAASGRNRPGAKPTLTELDTRRGRKDCHT